MITHAGLDDGYYVGAVSGHSVYDWGITTIERELQHDQLPGLPHAPLADHLYLARLIAAPGLYSLPATERALQPYPFSGIEAIPPKVHTFDAAALYPTIDESHRLYRIHFATPQLETLAWHIANGYQGDPYYYGGIALSLLYCTLGLQDKWYNSERATVFCSMLATVSLRAGSVPLLADPPTVEIAKHPTERLTTAPPILSPSGMPISAGAQIALPPSNVTPARAEWWLATNPKYAQRIVV